MKAEDLDLAAQYGMEQWVTKRMEWNPLVYDPIRSQAISNVRAKQELEQPLDQDQLEVDEFERLVRKEADKLFAQHPTRRNQK